MPLFREGRDFADGIVEAASRLGVPTAFVEKDYWITQILRTLHVIFPGEFLLKGGTSLSKGYGIIQRFSEDIDILVVRRSAHSASKAYTRLRGMTTGTAGALDLAWEQVRDPGRGLFASRGDTISYPTTADSSGLDLGIRHGNVLLETGFAGGPEPSEICAVDTLLGSALEIPKGQYEDLDEFALRMLVPRRTLVEKCAGLHQLAATWAAERPPTDRRFGRHYYDIYQLLGHQPTVDGLADRDQYRVMVDDVTRVSSTHFGATLPHPANGFGDSPAFRPEPGSKLREWLESAYVESQVLITRAGTAPSFGSILARVEEHAALLR